MTDLETKMELISHFHPDSLCYSGWGIKVTKQRKTIVKKFYSGALEIVNDLIISKKKPKWNPELVIWMLKEERDVYKTEADRLYYGMKNLVSD